MDKAATDIFTYDAPVILVGAAPVCVSALLRSLPKEWSVVAADGGAQAAIDAGRAPEVVLGDMDSIDRHIKLPPQTRLVELTGQDDTDFEKAVSRVRAPLIIGLGFLGGRFDHTLAVMHALACIDHTHPILLIGDSDVVLRVKGDFSAALDPGMRFSIWPLGQQHFATSDGLRWPLTDLAMAPGKLIGTSNEVIDSQVSISAGTGDGYAVITPLAAFDALLTAVLSTVSNAR